MYVYISIDDRRDREIDQYIDGWMDGWMEGGREGGRETGAEALERRERMRILEYSVKGTQEFFWYSCI